jgi:hypothetical protein
VADLLADELRKLRNERDRVGAELTAVDMAAKPIDVESEAERVTARLDSLSADLNEKVDPATLREVVRRMVDRIDLFFDRVPRGKRVNCPLSKGVINLRRDSTIFSLECRVLTTSIELFLSGIATWEPHVGRLLIAA